LAGSLYVKELLVKTYTSPTVTSWGTITDLTLGNGMTFSTDDFVSCTPEGPFSEEKGGFVGSNGNTSLYCDGLNP
jgi:hypothetical protein